jgi:hypothetical protein
LIRGRSAGRVRGEDSRGRSLQQQVVAAGSRSSSKRCCPIRSPYPYTSLCVNWSATPGFPRTTSDVSDASSLPAVRDRALGFVYPANGCGPGWRDTSVVLLRYLRTPDSQEATVDAVADPSQWAVRVQDFTLHGGWRCLYLRPCRIPTKGGSVFLIFLADPAMRHQMATW